MNLQAAMDVYCVEAVNPETEVPAGADKKMHAVLISHGYKHKGKEGASNDQVHTYKKGVYTAKTNAGAAKWTHTNEDGKGMTGFAAELDGHLSTIHGDPEEEEGNPDAKEAKTPQKKKSVKAGGPGSGRHKGDGVNESQIAAIAKKHGYKALAQYDDDDKRYTELTHPKTGHTIDVTHDIGYWTHSDKQGKHLADGTGLDALNKHLTK